MNLSQPSALLQRWRAGAHAYGPLLQGTAGVIHDLSRGCNADDVVAVVTIAAYQAALKWNRDELHPQPL